MKGIDISQWQGAVDFAKVKSAVDFVILREGYRNTTDARFMEYAKGAKAAGIPIVGVYHFIYATNAASAKVEASNCVAHVKAAGLPTTTVIWADLEYDTVTKAKKAGITLTAQMQREITIAFCEEIKRLGYPTGIYANDDYMKNVYGASISKQYDIWLADYYGSPDYDCVYHQTGSTGRVNGINGNVDTDIFVGKYTAGTAKVVDMDGKDSSITTPPTVSQRDIFVGQLQKWIGKNEYDGSFKTIIDTYNSGLSKAVGVWGTRNVRMLYSWPWCACTVSAAAIAAGLDTIVPIEISCPYMIIMAQKHGIWVENDAYVPQKGDIVLYDWQDNGVGDNRGEADHVGVVESVNGKDMVIIEGNYSDSVKRRPLRVDGQYIRGYIVPKFTATAGQNITYTNKKSVEEIAREVLAGKWGNGDARKAALTQAGYDYSAVQAMVNQLMKGTTAQHTPQPTQTTTAKREVKATAAAQGFSKSLAGKYTVTASALNMRKGAGTGYGVMISLPRGTAVQCYGYYTSVGGVKWLYVQATYNGTSYIGFCSSAYLKR